MAITGAPQSNRYGTSAGAGRPSIVGGMTTDPRTGRPISRNELTRRNAQETFQQQQTEARGEVFVPDPYGVAGGPFGRPSGPGGPGGFGGVGGVGGVGPAGNNIVASPGGGGGGINLSRGSYEDQQMLLLRDKLNKENFSSRLAALSGASGTPSRVGGGGVAGNEEAARSAAFARAKDRAGSTALASLKALQNVLQNRGMLGSTEEARLTAEGIGSGANVFNEFAREELINDLNRAAEISDRDYAGDITQRGQDLSARQSLLALINSAGLY